MHGIGTPSKMFTSLINHRANVDTGTHFSSLPWGNEGLKVLDSLQGKKQGGIMFISHNSSSGLGSR